LFALQRSRLVPLYQRYLSIVREVRAHDDAVLCDLAAAGRAGSPLDAGPMMPWILSAMSRFPFGDT
jgi:hypothetical protein